MSNFIEAFKAGQEGRNMGLTTGLTNLDEAINGMQKKTSIGLAAAQKVGKTALCDFCFLVKPYLQQLKRGRLENINWIYNSYEIDRVSKEFKIAALFMFLDCHVYKFEYKDVEYLMSHNYISGRQLHRNPKTKAIEGMVPMTEEHKEMLRGVYYDRIVPLFGEYYKDGTLKTPGKVKFVERAETPTAVRDNLVAYFHKNGTAKTEKIKVRNRDGKLEDKTIVIAYNENNPDLQTVVITDHYRKLLRERGNTMKDNLDKWLEYSTELVNGYNATMINIAHSNRNISNVERLKFSGETIYPTADDVKDTGNLAEESHILLTMLNPNDEKYNLEFHMGVEIAGKKHPYYRSLHVADARWVDSPQHMRLNMFGQINLFEPLKIKPVTNGKNTSSS